MIFLTTRIIIKNDWITIIFILIFFLLAVIKWLYKDRLFHLGTLFFSKNYFLKYGKEPQLIFNWFNVFFFGIQLLILGLLAVSYITFYRPEVVEENSLQLFVKLVAGIALFFLLRYIIGKLLAVLFELNKQHEHITFAKISYLYSSVLIILPFCLLIFYVKEYNLLAFQLTIAIFTILLVARYVVIFKNNKNSIFSRLFYFIMYLCALEIAPVLLVYKMIA